MNLNPKRKVFFYLSNKSGFQRIRNIFVKLNCICFHWNGREHYVKYGNEDENKTFYVIRSRGKTEGLLSSVLYVINEAKWANRIGFIPVVDFTNSSCQYYVNRPIHGKRNAWEYYFIQPSNLGMEDIRNKKNVLLSGWNFKKTPINESLCNKDVLFQPYIHNIVNEFWAQNFQKKKVLGVFIRGTDYASLKPKNHSVQPSIEQMLEKMNEFMERYSFERIFVVTEDYSYYTKITSLFKEKVFSYSDDFIKDYNTNDYISESLKDDPYIRGLNYLIRILLLSKCEYTICSKASGSSFMKLIREKEPLDEYWFELGVY